MTTESPKMKRKPAKKSPKTKSPAVRRPIRDVYAVPTYVDEHGVANSYMGVHVGRASSLAGAMAAARKEGFRIIVKGGENGLAPASAFHGSGPMVYAITVFPRRRR